MNPWLLTYDGFDPAREGLREALTTLGNGYFATRGAATEASADEVHYPGTYVAGCYNRLISQIADRSVDNEDLVNTPNWLPLTFRAAGGDWPALGHAEILTCRHQLDMRHGVLTRLLRVRDSHGRITRMHQRRLVSMDDPHLAALSATIVAENWSGPLEVRSALDGRVINSGVARYRGLANQHLTCVRAHGSDGDGVIELLARTVTSRVEIALAARTSPAGGRRRSLIEEDRVTEDLELEVKAGQEVTVEKIVALYTSRDRAIGDSASAARTACPRRAGPPAPPGTPVRCFPGRAAATAGRRRRACTSIPARAAGYPIIHTCSAMSGWPWPTTSGSTTRPPRTPLSWRVSVASCCWRSPGSSPRWRPARKAVTRSAR
jgi:trehalose/maltose hydrolase-like predicted phosphorylase